MWRSLHECTASGRANFKIGKSVVFWGIFRVFCLLSITLVSFASCRCSLLFHLLSLTPDSLQFTALFSTVSPSSPALAHSLFATSLAVNSCSQGQPLLKNVKSTSAIVCWYGWVVFLWKSRLEKMAYFQYKRSMHVFVNPWAGVWPPCCATPPSSSSSSSSSCVRAHEQYR